MQKGKKKKDIFQPSIRVYSLFMYTIEHEECLQDLQELKWHVHLETRTLNKVLGELKLVGKSVNKYVCPIYIHVQAITVTVFLCTCICS